MNDSIFAHLPSETEQKVDLVLASASPRRQDLLNNLGVQFRIAAADIDETPEQAEPPWELVTRLARAKAAHVQKTAPGAAILAADTVVAVEDEVFGKPRHQEHAMQMWEKLSGRSHQVLTSVCLLYADGVESTTLATDVTFAAVSEEQMREYWQSGEPQDKAGGYAIQGLASAWVTEIQGSFSNVVGLPLYETNNLLKLVGHNWL